MVEQGKSNGRLRGMVALSQARVRQHNRPLLPSISVDRLIQQTITQVLSPIFEKQFSDSSYGFRPNRSAHDALWKCQVHITDGYKYVVDMDLEKYFDTVNQSKLIRILSETIKYGGSYR